MATIRETSRKSGDAHLTLHKYRNVHNISHYHSDHELMLVHSGGLTVTVNGTAHRLTEGMGLFIRGGIPAFQPSVFFKSIPHDFQDALHPVSEYRARLCCD